MAVYYKFKSAKDFDSIPIDGHFISVANLKERIFEAKHLGRGTDFDLMVSNAQTNEEYIDEAMLIPKNTSVLIRRVPGRPRKPIVAEQEEPKVEDGQLVNVPQSKNSMSLADSSAMKIPEESEWDEFGNDLYDIPEALPVQASGPVVNIPPPNKVDEENKIKAFVDTTALDWQRQIQENFGSGRGFGRGMGGRTMAGRGFGRGGLVRKTPPQGYTCHRCNISGHFIQHCPTNGDPNYDIRRVKPPTGIPKSMLMATPDGSYALPSGAVAVLQPNEAAFEKEIEGLPLTRATTDLPPELHCPLCKEVMKDAVLTSKCCFSSFCDKCIRDYIISKSICVCGATNILADDLLPNKTLRETINRILESTTSSAENGGSLLQVQDMESARPAQLKAPSPTQSATSKEERKATSAKEHTEIKQVGDENEDKEVSIAGQSLSLENKTLKPVGLSEATPESMSTKEPTSQESAPVPEEDAQEKIVSSDQGKKKKKKRIRLPGSADMQWRTFPDVGAENFPGMPLAPSAYNPCFAGMPWGMDGYMAPFPGAMSLMGYAPGPFDVPFGGILPQDPFAAQGFMMPILPQGDLSELSMGAVNTNQFPPGMRREEIEARKAELRRKREAEHRVERGHSRDREISRDAGSSIEISLRPKPRLMSQAAAMDRDDRRRHMRAPSLDRGKAAREPSLDRGKAPRAPSLDRSDRAERSKGGAPRASSVDRAERTKSVDASRYSPPRGSRRKPEHHDEVPPPPPPPPPAGSERRQKGSVFSRISFPDSSAADGGGKKRKTPEAPNGFKQDHESVHRRASSSSAGHHEDDSRRGAKAAPSVVGTRRGVCADEHESDEEDRHFKRRPSSSSARHEAGERVEDGRLSRGSRERDRGIGREHDPHASKRR
uniref:E3 ubiquitin-protein ligase RBBP6 n=1 Tax=Anthurium amnicola TaxID=1678845 RepID=A0A1D1Z2T2_9ARAE